MWTLIPQLFYDFLARIVPGAILLFFSTLVVFGPAAAAKCLLTEGATILNSFYTLAMVILLSYLIGYILGPLFEYVTKKLNKNKWEELEKNWQEERVKEHNRMLTELGYSYLQIKVEAIPKEFVMRDYLRSLMPTEVARLLKLRAERRLCHVLIIGFGLLFLLNLFYFKFESSWLFLEIFFSGALLVCWLNQGRLHEYSYNGVIILWLIQASSGHIPILKPIEKK